MSRPSSLSRALLRSSVLSIACAAICSVAHAQTTRPAPPRPAPTGPTPRAGSFEISGGVTFAGGFELGDSAAELTRNTTSGSTSFDLFSSDSELGPAFGVGGRLGYYFSPRLAVEGGVSWSRPVLTINLTGDTEGAPDTESEETLDRWIIDGAVVWHLTQPRAGRPAPFVPFVFGGVGYLRELHEGQQFVETGVVYQAGGGMKYWFGNARRRFGLRGDAGISLRDGGFDFEEDGIRMVPVFSGSLVYLF